MKKRLIKPLCVLFALITVFSSFAITVSAADTKTVTSGNFVFSIKDKTATLTEYKGDAKTVKVPSKINGATVRAIGDYAFWQKKNMKTVSLPKTVKSIGEAAFNECTSLKEVKMPYYLTEIKNAAFWYCTNLETVLMNKKAKTFGENVFKGCKKLTVYVYEDTKAESFAKKQADIKVGYYYAEKLKASKSISCELSKTVNLSISTVPENVYGVSYTYKTSDKNVVSVSSKGVVKGLKVGTATVTATTKNTKDGKAKSVKIKITVKPQKVASLKVSDKTPTSYKLSWDKAKGAVKYRIYVKNASKKWVKLADTSNNYYTVKNLTVGSSASYRVKSFATKGKETYYSAYSNTLTASVLTPAKVSGLKSDSRTENSVTLTWAKTPYATGYRIYSYNASLKKFTYVAYTTLNTYTFKNLKANTCYAYAVKAYFTKNNTSVFSDAYSNVLYCYTNPASVTGLKELENSSAADSFCVTWDSMPGITGYELSYSTANDTQWKTVNIPSNLNVYKFTKISDVTDYNFRIRAVRTVGTAVYQGPYSKTVSIKVSAIPTDNNEALEAFATALNNAETYSLGFNLFVNKTVADLYEETQDPRIKDIISDIENSIAFSQYNFKDGKETKNSLTLKQVMSPDATENVFSKELVDAEKLSYKVDGSGYSMEFYVNDEKGNMFTPAINWQALADKHGFTLENVTYETYIDQTKIQNNKLDTLKSNVTFSADITFGEETFNLKGTVSYLYIFNWLEN